MKQINIKLRGLRNNIKEIPLKSIKTFLLDVREVNSADVYRLADRIRNGKSCPLPVVNETTNHFIGNKVVLYAMRQLSYDKVPVVMLKLTRAEEMAIFHAFLKESSLRPKGGLNSKPTFGLS